jgi:hypothetical protein
MTMSPRRGTPGGFVEHIVRLAEKVFRSNVPRYLRSCTKTPAAQRFSSC